MSGCKAVNPENSVRLNRLRNSSSSNTEYEVIVVVDIVLILMYEVAVSGYISVIPYIQPQTGTGGTGGFMNCINSVK